jgi:ethanolamine transporter EutH
MNGKLGTIIVLIAFAFPFLTLGIKMLEDSLIGGVSYFAMVIALVITIVLAPRVKLKD